MASKQYKYTSDEFLNYLRNEDPSFQTSYYKDLSDERLYRLGMKRYSGSRDDVEPLTPSALKVEKPKVDVSPGFFGSLPRWGVDENSADWMKSAYANSLQGMSDQYEDGSLPF